MYSRIPTQRTIPEPRWQVHRRHSVLHTAPSERSSLRSRCLLRAETFLDAPVRRYHSHLIHARGEPFCKRPHFYWGPAKFQKGGVGFRYIQDSHCSRRIFFSALAKTLKRNSRSTRCRPRPPIFCASAGSESNVSIEVASCAASPCGTRYPVPPSSIASGAPPSEPPITG